MLVRVIQITARHGRAEEKRMKILENVAWDLSATQRSVDLWDGNVVISGLRIFYWKPGLHDNSFVIVSLISNNTDISKVHFVVVFMENKDPDLFGASRWRWLELDPRE